MKIKQNDIFSPFLSFSEMFVLRRRNRFFLNEIQRRTLIAERIPQYQERSALLPGGVNTPFPIVLVPDVDLELLFKSHERLKENLQRRHWIVDVKKVEDDYKLWKKLDKNLAEASARRVPVGSIRFPNFLQQNFVFV